MIAYRICLAFDAYMSAFAVPFGTKGVAFAVSDCTANAEMRQQFADMLSLHHHGCLLFAQLVPRA